MGEEVADAGNVRSGMRNVDSLVDVRVVAGDRIAVWFSCGAASAVAAKRTLELYRDRCDVRIVNNPVAEEDADNRRFLRDVEAWLGVRIELATNWKYPEASAVAVWDKASFMAGIAGAPCTERLKKHARQQWEARHVPQWHVLGFDVTEKHRHEKFITTERSNVLPVLIDANLTKTDCAAILLAAGLRLPAAYERGYPNANCIGCVKATSATYWNHVKKMDPEVFAARAEQSRRLKARLVRYKGERIYLDELPDDAVGAPMKSVECGTFCEER